MESKKYNSRLVAAKLLTIAISQSACGIAQHSGPGISISGDPEGLRAYFDGLNHLVTNGKAPNDAQDTPAYNLRRMQSLQVIPRVSQRAEQGGK